MGVFGSELLRAPTCHHLLRGCRHETAPPSAQELTWFRLPIRFGPGGLAGALMLGGLPPLSATFPTLITADIMVLMEDRSDPSKPVGGLDVIGTTVYASGKPLSWN